ncbi:MAG: hypothetical protein QMD50_01300 [Patescibacteria group bacterium]|nr:hypothetical protein [Patescibacteria group bacterium]
MKWVLNVAIILVIAVLGIGCYQYKPDDYDMTSAKKFYETPHKLRKMFVKDQEITVKEPSGGFFLFVGVLGGNYKEGSEVKYSVTHVRFAWEIKDNLYIITTLPVEKARIQLAKSIEIPTAQFFINRYEIDRYLDELTEHGRGKNSDRNNKEKLRQYKNEVLDNFSNPEKMIAHYLDYVVFNVKDGDWSSNINLPTNSNFSN